MDHFQPRSDDRPCWWCIGYLGLDASGTCALCARPGHPRRRTQPERGCSGFVREVGADDEPALVPAALRGARAPGALGDPRPGGAALSDPV